MIVLGILLALSSSSRAQIAPAPAPAPAAAPAPVGQLQSADPAVVGAKLDDLFRRFTSGRPMIPTLKEVQAENLRRDLAPRPGERGSSETAPRSELTVRPPGERRRTGESVDVAVSRPLPRVELGVGFSERNVYVGTRRLEADTSKYAFLRIDLSRITLARKLFHSPTAVHTETAAGEQRVRVSSDEYSIHSLPKP